MLRAAAEKTLHHRAHALGGDRDGDQRDLLPRGQVLDDLGRRAPPDERVGAEAVVLETVGDGLKIVPRLADGRRVARGELRRRIGSSNGTTDSAVGLPSSGIRTRSSSMVLMERNSP
jgi:hypothetical protein